MIPQNGRNGNGTAVADVVPEATSNVPEATTAPEQTIDLATRTRQRARQQFQQNKFVIIGAGALVTDAAALRQGRGAAGAVALRDGLANSLEEDLAGSGHCCCCCCCCHASVVPAAGAMNSCHS